jgi:hypothetical protein
VFWSVSYLYPILWVVLGLLHLLTFNLPMFFLSVLCIVMSGANLLGYIRCQKNHRQMIQGMIYSKAKENISQEQINKMATMAAEQAMKA